MHFDDRLATVLDQPADDTAGRVVRWRQLVELLARAPREALPGATGQEALSLVAADRALLSLDARAAAYRAIAGLDLPPELLSALIHGEEPSVVAPLLAAARLDMAGWTDLLVGTSEPMHVLVRALHGVDISLVDEPSNGADDAAPETEAEDADLTDDDDNDGNPDQRIDDILARIERIRGAMLEGGEGAAAADKHLDDETADPQETARLPEVSPAPTDDRDGDIEEVGAGNGLFRWSCDARGDIGWVDGVPRAAWVGRSLLRDRDGMVRTATLSRLIESHAPFRDEAVSLAFGGPAGGEWQLTGLPLFDPDSGRFLGYRGVARRPGSEQRPATTRETARRPVGQSLREMVHEVRTPLNAIIGFAEIIDGQYLGPAHRRYRERAAGIVAQARSLLAALDDLDLAARLQDGKQVRGNELHSLPHTILSDLVARGAACGVKVELAPGIEQMRCEIDPELAGRLVGRFFEALVDSAEPGEKLRLAAIRRPDRCMLLADRPLRTRGLTTDELLDPAYGAGGAADAGRSDDASLSSSVGSIRRLGLGFKLRLVRGLVRLAGGDLIVDDETLALILMARQR